MNKQIIIIMVISLILNKNLLQDGFGNLDKIFKQFDKAFTKDFQKDFFTVPLFQNNFDLMFNDKKDIINESDHDPIIKERIKKINKLSKRQEVFKHLKKANKKIKTKLDKNSKKLEKLDKLGSIFDDIKNKDNKTERIIKNYKDGTTIEILQKSISPNVQMVVEKIEKLSKPLLNDENHDEIKKNIKNIKEIQNDLKNKNNLLDNFFDDSNFFEDSFTKMFSQIEKDFKNISQERKKGEIKEDHPLLKNIDATIKKMENEQSHIKIENLRNIHKKQKEMIDLQSQQNEHIKSMKVIENGIRNGVEEKEEKIRDIVQDLNEKKDISKNKKKEVRKILSVISS